MAILSKERNKYIIGCPNYSVNQIIRLTKLFSKTIIRSNWYSVAGVSTLILTFIFINKIRLRLSAHFVPRVV